VVVVWWGRAGETSDGPYREKSLANHLTLHRQDAGVYAHTHVHTHAQTHTTL